MRTYFRLVSIVFILLLSFQSALGIPCKCIIPDTKDAFEKSDIAFTGKVVDITTNWMSGGLKITFQVEQMWKQQLGSILVVNTGWDHKCGYNFEKDQSYLVYATRSRSIRSNRCSGNKLLSKAKEDLSILGPAMSPRKEMSKTMKNSFWLMTGLCVLGSLFLLWIVLRKKFRKSEESE